jgi:LacI family transcriptional regulator
VADSLAALKRPVVNVSRALADLPFPRVGVQEGQVGRLVAEHLLQRGFRHLAFVGSSEFSYSLQREAGFREVLLAAGHALARYETPADSLLVTRRRPWSADPRLRRWLLDLPKPVAIFGCNDQCGVQLAEACREADLRVPEDVALVGVDNDDLLCELARPALSSVGIPAEQIGYEAAALLDRLLQGAAPPAEPVLLPPLGLIVRQSSDVVAIEDRDVAAALCFIRDHAHVPLAVPDVLRAVPVSRRALERRARQAIGRTLGDEIRRVHLERAKNLLSGTDMPMNDVAQHSGFSSAKHFCTVFHQELGCTPTLYRRRYRGRSPQPADQDV